MLKCSYCPKRDFPLGIFNSFFSSRKSSGDRVADEVDLLSNIGGIFAESDLAGQYRFSTVAFLFVRSLRAHRPCVYCALVCNKNKNKN